MILLLCESPDPTADEVCAWLRAWGAPHLRMDAADPIAQVTGELRAGHFDFVLQTGIGRALPLSSVTATWFWRGVLPLWPPSRCRPELVPTLHRELEAISERITARLTSLPHLGHPSPLRLNKLTQLEAAAAAGLDIPPTLITTSRAEVLAFAAAHGSLITKAIDAPPVIAAADQTLVAPGTIALDTAALHALPSHFASGLFQARVPRDFELRVVLLDGHAWALAILDPNPDGAPVDRRSRPAATQRFVPFILPEPVASALSRMMQALDLSLGSADLIVTPDDRFVFLEVNPLGQLELVSKEGGYGLERQIAAALCQRACLTALVPADLPPVGRPTPAPANRRGAPAPPDPFAAIADPGEIALPPAWATLSTSHAAEDLPPPFVADESLGGAPSPVRRAPRPIGPPIPPAAGGEPDDPAR